MDDENVTNCQDNVVHTIAIDIKLQETLKKKDGLIKENRELKMTIAEIKQNKNNLAECFEIKSVIIREIFQRVRERLQQSNTQRGREDARIQNKHH